MSQVHNISRGLNRLGIVLGLIIGGFSGCAVPFFKGADQASPVDFLSGIALGVVTFLVVWLFFLGLGWFRRE